MRAVGKSQYAFAGAEILENCQEYMHRLAAWDLPPGASAINYNSAWL